MQSVSRLFLLAFASLPLAFGQLETIGVVTSGVTPTSTASSTVLASSSLATSNSSISTPLTTPAPNATTTTTGNPLVLTTIFTQPSGCSGGMTEVASWGTELWQNIVNPVPTLTLSSCYPSQFYYSAVATEVLPPYIQLVCPENWETYNVTETYIICCPGGYGLYAPNYQNTTRPGLGAVCTSVIGADVLMDVTSYNSTAFATVIPTIAGVNGTMVFATAFDGTAATSVVTSTSTSATSTVPSTTSTITLTTLSDTSSTTSSTSVASVTSTPSTTSTTSTTGTASLTAISQLPSCGQTCFDNMLAEYETLGCTTSDPSCLCRNINFYYGIRDCSNAACSTDNATTVLDFESTYCASAIAAQTTYPVTTSTAAAATPTALSDLSTCGQTCFDNMLAEYATLGCTSETDTACLCENIDFYYGLRDCSGQACGSDEAATVVAYESYYCAQASATAVSS
ncbi:hypothetical protein BO70DRAFT_393479 [Aspergillus heteromorphus CBS 117.55]|uniref:CFEM domain-containing protein n=1 Tax=Aspergillus heteromorphus CBS 117.55 TaxID=1448321 RepID=A0A317WXI8_9EURO|nr:uncharacterized protein BO70DRAFT_393479 [Aspergillus heteromorphus CBS 117.55]PWY88960.1 hypothetical protein BO70DRAFT_393479 [Aspergillus heteromorphus CBS 117.55]